MTLSYVTGSLGMGKSAYAARRIGRAFLEGRVVATNMRLVDGWEFKVARRLPGFRLMPRVRREAVVETYRRRYFTHPDVEMVTRVRIHGRGERRGLMVLDEADNELNVRDWKEVENRRVARRMKMARKLGWEVLVISQHEDNTDVALRRIVGQNITLLNWRRLLRVPGLGVELLPFHLFLAQTWVANVKGVNIARKPIARELFVLGWWASLYDTFEQYGNTFDDEEGIEPIWLPRMRDERPSTPGGPLRGLPA